MRKRENVKTWKKLVAVVMVMLLLIAASECVLGLDADRPNGEPIRSKYIDKVTVNITYSSGVVTASTNIRDTVHLATKIVCTMYLQRYENGSWRNVVIWSQSNQGGSMYVRRTSSVSTGTYRVRSKVTAYKGNDKEVIIECSESVVCN